MENKKELEVKAYDPSIQAHLQDIRDRWGTPDENKMSLVKYGIKQFDIALFGIDTLNGELNLVLGPEKQRKTTFAINLLINIMMAELPEVKPLVVIDTLESGMHPDRYVDTLVANLASRWLIMEGHNKEGCKPCRDKYCKLLSLSPEFLRFKDRVPEQLKAIDWALATMKNWNVYIYGAMEKQGNTRALEPSVVRWKRLHEEKGAKIYFIDHIQQYDIGFGFTSDYEKQIQAVKQVGNFVAQYKTVVFLLSQVSLTSQRDARDGKGRIGASGGQKAAQEANTVFATRYEPNSGQMEISIIDSRKAGRFSVIQPLDDVSGAFYGETTRKSDVIGDNKGY